MGFFSFEIEQIILNTPQKADALPAAPYLSLPSDTNTTTSTAAVNPNVILSNVRLEDPNPAPYSSYQAQAGPMRSPNTEAAHIMLRDQEPSSLPAHIDPAKVPVLHCCTSLFYFQSYLHPRFFL